MRKRIFASMLVVVLAVCMLGGCTSQQSGPVKVPENLFEEEDDGIVDLTVWADESNMELMEKLIENFKAENSDTKFNFTLVAQGESDCMNALLSDVKNAGDVFHFADDQLNSLVAGGMLSQILNSVLIKNANTASSVSASQCGGSLYAYPMTADNGYFLYYNKDYFSEEDVKTLDGILKVCQDNNKYMTMELTSGWYLYSFFGLTGMKMGLNEDGVTNHCNWNESGKVTGLEVAKALKKIVDNPGFKSVDDKGFVDGVKDGTIIAGVSGVWNAVNVKEAWGDNYGAVKLPTYTVGDQQIQMASFTGFKMVGVNAYSKEESWAHKFANYITNQESQTLRFVMRNQGPSNIKAAASEEVSKVPAIQAVIAQSQYGTLQRVGNSYWDACTLFAETLIEKDPSEAELQELLDTLVESITQSVMQ